MLEKFKTILNEGQAEMVEKKSRFIATVRPVQNEDEARNFIEEIKKRYWDARHNVFAYQIGERNEIQRFSDDGEPQGTAGMPILDVLKGEDIKNTAIVVTRYFGGTLLGTGGLVRAYGRTAKEGILNAGIADISLYNEFSIITDYNLSGKIQYEIMQNEYILRDTIYSDKVEFVVFIEASKSETFKNNIINITNAAVEIHDKGTKYGYWLKGDFSLLQ